MMTIRNHSAQAFVRQSGQLCSSKQSRRGGRGFTLLEVLVALGIVTIISLLSWQGLQEVLRMVNRLDEVDLRFQRLGAVFDQLELDLADVELGVGQGKPSADYFRVSTQGLYMVVTRRQGELPSYQQEVAWSIRDGRLQRASRPLGALPGNGASGSQSERSEVVTAGPTVKGMRIRQWQDSQGWVGLQTIGAIQPLNHETPVLKGRPNPLAANEQATQGQPAQPGGTPASGAGASGAAGDRPRALEITLALDNGQRLLRVFKLGGEY